MACLIAFQSAMKKDPSLKDELDIVCFERQGSWGGIWNFTLETGVDEFGEPIHSSMYKYLFSNAPKECLEFADYTFEEHFGNPIATYPPREVLWHYLEGRVEKAGVSGWCRFRTAVRHVAYDERYGVFEVSSHDLFEDEAQTETFDHVVVASGRKYARA
jgi:trimethylamine monooxygenase